MNSRENILEFDDELSAKSPADSLKCLKIGV